MCPTKAMRPRHPGIKSTQTTGKRLGYAGSVYLGDRRPSLAVRASSSGEGLGNILRGVRGKVLWDKVL